MLTLNFSATHRCNYNCLHCGTKLIREQNLGREEVVTPETVRAYLKDTPVRVKAICVGGGGEPTLYKRLPELCKTAINEVKPRYFCTISNVSDPKLMKDVTEAVLETDVDIFFPGFSLDGVGEVHNQTRQAAEAYSNVIKTLEITNKMREGDDRIVPGISYTLGSWNYKELLKVFYLSLSYKAAFSFRFAMPVSLMKFTEEIYDDVERQIKVIESIIDNELVPRPPVSFGKEYLRWVVHHAKTGERPYPCKVPELNLYVDAYGDIYPCCGSVWIKPDKGESYKIGNILNSNLEETYSSELRMKVIAKLKNCQICWDEGSYALSAEEYVKDVEPLFRPEMRVQGNNQR